MKLKKILFFVPLIALLAFAGCMTPQVELRQEYDKLVKAITFNAVSQEERDAKKAGFLAPAESAENAKEVLEYIWNAAQNARAAALETVPDAKITLTTFGFKVTKAGATKADVHFMLSVTGKDFTAPVMLMNMNPEIQTPEINLHWYKISANAEKTPVYNLIFDYAKTNGEWKISGIEDSGADKLTAQELQALFTK